ncbi:MAG: SGNH/GDSL hydrolase family protein [Ginsengibacter sp.]
MKKYNIPVRSFLFFLLCLLVVLSVYSCSKKGSMEVAVNPLPVIPDTAIVPPPAAGKPFLALGDSYTIGQSVQEAARFPNQTAQILTSSQVAISKPDIIATTGWTTANLLNALNINPPHHNYTIVTLLIGVNNQYQHKSLDEYKIEFTRLLDSAITYAGNIKSHVFVLSIPDYSVTPFAQGSDMAAIAREIDEFNAANKKISDDYHVQYLDITAISREALSNPDLNATDGLHPSGSQYRRWAELLADMIKKSL